MNTDFWLPVPIPPQQAIAELYSYVLARSEKRSPKWKFRLRPDLIIEIQPKCSKSVYLFECRALRLERAGLEHLVGKAEALPPPYYKMKFVVRAQVSDQWVFQARSLSWSRGAPRPTALTLKGDLIEAFAKKSFDRLNPKLMLGYHCLCCGKTLTDPVSMARFIGPECWGNDSANLPFLTDLSKSRYEKLICQPR
jgi:Family of unknown function (DUF6011)